MTMQRNHSGSYVHADDPGEPSTGRPRWSVTDDEAGVLRELARGRRVLEIGTGLGVSTRALAATARHVTTVDVDPWVWANVWPTLPAAVVARATVPSGPVRPFDLALEPFDLAFIDGAHDSASVERDVRAVLPLLAPDGAIAFHDVAYASVREVCDALGPMTLYETRHGIGLMRVAEMRGVK